MERKFYILESLRKTDQKTGNEIYLAFKDKADFTHQPYSSKEELFNILKRIKIETEATGKRPFVHFDCHGNNDGIGVVNQDQSEELIGWREISDAFREIYKSSKKRAVICMSSCEGFNAIKIVSHFDTCPYEYISGSFEKIGFADSLNGYKLFYEQIINGEELVKAGIKVHQDFDKLKFICLSSAQLFEIAEKGYLKVKTTPEEIAKEKANTIAQAQLIMPLTEDVSNYINYRYSDAGIAEYLQEWRRIFFS